MEELDYSLNLGFNSIFSIVFTLIIVIIIGMVVYQLVNFFLNIASDKVTVDARLISKDSQTHHSSSENGMSSSTSYSFTFETTTGERIILDVSYKVFRQYAMGDFGELTYQRKWLKEFNLK